MPRTTSLSDKQTQTGGIGQLTASAIELSAIGFTSGPAVPPIRLRNQSAPFDFYDGKGVPSFTVANPSIYFRNDGVANTMVYVNPTGATWTALVTVTGSGVTSVTGDGVSITASPTTGAVVVSPVHGDYVDLVNAQTVAGIKTFSSPIESTATTTDATKVAIYNDNAATKGWIFNVPSASTNGFQFKVNEVQKAVLDASGNWTVQGNLKALGGANISTGKVGVQIGLGLSPTGVTADKFPGTPVGVGSNFTSLLITGYTAYALTAGVGGTTVITVTATNPTISRTISLATTVNEASISGFTDTLTSTTLYLPTVSTGGFGALNISLFATGTQVVN